LSKKYNIPISREDLIASYRKKNANVCHYYHTLANQHSSLGKFMLNFTAPRGGTYQKLRLINEIKSYVTYLIANSKSEIYFFSSIEIGHELTNPHLHTQLWTDDEEAVRAIYDKVIKKFRLVKKWCKLSTPHEPHQTSKIYYTYLIKDYDKGLTDDQVWKLEQTKKKYRKQLGTKFRFYSRSKGKYTVKLYKMVYHTYKVLRALADDFIDFMIDTFFVRKSLRRDILDNKKVIKLSFISSFILIENKGFECVLFEFICSLEILFFAPATDPPFGLCVLDGGVLGMTVSFALRW
jgi:hypothetical protein